MTAVKQTILALAIAIVALLFTPGSNASQMQFMERAKPGKHDKKVISAVTLVLEAQVAAWNQGDIEKFMEGYFKSDATLFISGDKVTRGWQTVLDRYKLSYSSREKMGTLAFTDLEITPVGDDTAIAVGRWQLTRAGDTPHGRFTLIFRKTSAGWRIVHDHTSSA